MLQIRLLGELAVESSSGPIQLSGSWRARSLLAWLALNPGSHRRADLAARFWPEVLDSSARASLRNAIWTLRRTLGSEAGHTLLATRDRVSLTGPEVWIDVRAFRDHVEHGRFEAAVGLCGGELLAGLDEEWVYEYRDAHNEHVSEVLERLAGHAEATADFATAISLTRRRVALDPLAEDAQRALIARLAAVGDRAGALGAYARLRDRLRRELGISPSQQTRELAARLRDDAATVEPSDLGGRHGKGSGRIPDVGWRPGMTFPLPPGLDRPPRSTFVGRGAEMAMLRRAWSRTCAGEGARMVLVTGESGIGKSRLAREMALSSGGEDAVVLHGAAAEELLVPYQPFVEALRHYLTISAPEELCHRIRPRARDLEPIIPSLPRPIGQTPPDGASGDSRRYRLFDAFSSLLGDLSRDAPVLLVLDDLQWADHSSIALLRHMLVSRPETRLLVLATSRQGERSTHTPLGQALGRLVEQGLLERVPLAGLLDADVAELCRSQTGRKLSPELVEAIRSEAAGNPFFVQELVRHLSEFDEGAGLLSLARGELPDSVRAVVNLRLAPLGDNCVRLLTVAAVLGTEFELEPLERVSDLQGEDLVGALDEALAADVVVELAYRDRECFAFSHALVRRTLLERLSRAQRRRIHARVAEALETSRGDAALTEIAHHLCEAMPAADRERALDYATRAAEQATADLAYAEAVDLFTRALSLLPEDHERRRILALKRALAYQALTHVVMDNIRPEARADPVTFPTTTSSVIALPPRE